MAKKNKKKDARNVNENKVRIEVFRRLGGAVPYSIAKFEATQMRDDDNNLTLVEMNANFKDDVDIIQHKLMKDLSERLELHKLDHDERIELVKERILKQQDFIASIKEGYIIKKIKREDKIEEVKVKVNHIDEECKLTEYEVLLDHLKNNGEGSYETIDADGMKKIYYLYKEGVFIPYKWIKEKTSLYPDITTRRKLYKENQNAIDLDFFNDNKGFMAKWGKYIMWALILIMLIANIYWSVQLNKGYSTLEETKAEQFGTQCAYWCSEVVGNTKSFINAYDTIMTEKENAENVNTVSVG